MAIFKACRPFFICLDSPQSLNVIFRIVKNKKLFRLRKDRIIGGVCAGLADYFEIDPIIMRLIFLALLFAGAGLLIYIIAWIFIPSK